MRLFFIKLCGISHGFSYIKSVDKCKLCFDFDVTFIRDLNAHRSAILILKYRKRVRASDA